MLNPDAIFTAVTVAEQFDANGIVLAPLAGSPLHHLVASCNIRPEMAGKLDDGSLAIDFFGIEQAANSKEANFDRSRHDYAMSDFVGVSAGAVRNALNITRTYVAPRIAELLELVTMRLSNAPVSELSNLRISEDDDCPAIYGPNLRRLVDTFANYHNAEPLLAISGESLSTGEIIKLMETGVASIDDVLLPWAASLPEYQIQDTYNNFFTVKNGGDQRGFYGRMNKSTSNMVIVYCIARNLIENDMLLDGVTLDLKGYRSALKEIMAQSAHMLAIQMERNDTAIKNGNMVRSITMNEIRVFPPVYRAWLENGGDTDVLYGMAVSGKQKFTVDSIMADAAEYIKSWRSYSAMITSRDSASKFNYLREQLVMVYAGIVSKPNDVGASASVQEIKAEMDRFKAALRTMSVKDADDLHSMCLRLVCRASFANTPAELILSKMDEESKRNPNLSPREAGALATIWYISSWVAAQIVPTSA